MRTPEFWHRAGNRWGALLSPLGLLYDAAGQVRRALTRPTKLDRPVICVGNLTSGGAGKTPVALAIVDWFLARGRHPHVLSRGYGGHEAGPLRVDPAKHDFRAVGDEPLLLARHCPTWIATNRAAGGRAAVAAGAEIVVMDDGLQNPSLAKDLSLLVVDGGYGFGNGRVIPAGPLRETIGHGLARANAAVLVGEDTMSISRQLDGRLPILAGSLVPDRDAKQLAGQRVVAFAGIGRPGKFFATLESLGCQVLRRYGFADHHAYDPDEIMRLVEEASQLKAELVTTEKDLVRLPAEARAMVGTVRVRFVWHDEEALDRLLRPLLDAHG